MVLLSPQTKNRLYHQAKGQSSKAAYSQADYARGIRSAVRGFWSGNLDYFGFYDAMYATIDRGLTLAYHEGAQQCGILPSELTIDEIRDLRFNILEQINYLAGFADDIELNSKKNGGKLTPLLTRAQLWVNRYNSVRNQAQVSACKDQKLMWELGATEQHCRTCFALNGKVKRASVWKRAGVRPQNAPNPLLECEGWKCDCRYIVTDSPITPGPLPSLP